MQDNIPDALITAFERQYDSSWNDPQLRNERLAMRYGWAAAMEAKPCLHQIQEPAPVLVAPAAVAVPENVREGAPYANPAFEKLARELGVWGTAQSAVCAQFWLAATPADHIAAAGKKVAAPAGWKLVPVQVPDSAFPWVSGGYSIDYRAHDPRDQKIIEDLAQRTWEAILDGIAATPAQDVVLPEPAGYLVLRQEAPIVGSEIKINRSIYTKNEPTGMHEKLYTEQQVRALLDTGGQAQAVTQDERAAWFALAMNAAAYIEDAANCLRDSDAKRSANGAVNHIREQCNALWDSAPQAQADARDAERWRELTRNYELDDDLCLVKFEKGSTEFTVLTDGEADEVMDAAIAAAKPHEEPAA